MFGMDGEALASLKWAGAVKAIAVSGILLTLCSGAGCAIQSLKRQGAMAHELATLREGRELVAESNRRVREADLAVLAERDLRELELMERIAVLQSIPEGGVGEFCPIDCKIPPEVFGQ